MKRSVGLARRVAFDYDGTLVLNKDGSADFRPGMASVPIPEAIGFARWLASAGGEVFVVTAREEAYRAGVERVLGHYGLEDATVYMPQDFPGIQGIAAWKSRILSTLRPDYFVGDMWFDAEAAALAGVPFVTAGRLHAKPVLFRYAAVRPLRVSVLVGNHPSGVPAASLPRPLAGASTN